MLKLMTKRKSQSLRSSLKIVSRLKRFFNKYEKAFLKVSRKALSRATKEFLDDAKSVIREQNLNGVAGLDFKFGIRDILYNYMSEGRRGGRELGLTEALELKQYRERQQKQKSLETGFPGFPNLIDGLMNEFTSALTSENKFVVNNFSVVPYEALSFYNDYSLYLTNMYDHELLSKAKQKIYSGIQNGLSVQDITFSLQDVFTNFSDWRLQNIARTELSKAFNQGRLDSFQAPALDGFIVALQFSGILDDNTSAICEDRQTMNNGEGLILKIGDPRIAANTPPLHFQCRSIWLPVDKYSLLEEGLDRYVGIFPDGLKQPLAGFGGKTPKSFITRKPNGPVKRS